MLCTQNIN